MWRRYLPLWGGAVAVGLVVGVGPTLWSSAPTVSVATQPKAAVQTMLEEAPSAEDQAWASRDDSSAETDSAPAAGGVRESFGFCHTGGGYNCVVDGVTIWLEGQNIRIADIDAPETHEYRCQAEKELGDRATRRLIQLVNSGSVTLHAIKRDEDTYGRKLRLVYVNGASVGDALVSEGLARYYGGGKQPWC